MKLTYSEKDHKKLQKIISKIDQPLEEWSAYKWGELFTRPSINKSENIPQIFVDYTTQYWKNLKHPNGFWIWNFVAAHRIDLSDQFWLAYINEWKNKINDSGFAVKQNVINKLKNNKLIYKYGLYDKETHISATNSLIGLGKVRSHMSNCRLFAWLSRDFILSSISRPILEIDV